MKGFEQELICLLNIVGENKTHILAAKRRCTRIINPQFVICSRCKASYANEKQPFGQPLSRNAALV